MTHNRLASWLFLWFLLSLSSTGFAAGSIAHMLIAKESIALLPDAKLRSLLTDNMDAYLVGSNYPDSGYVDGARYGEDSHWDPYISAFIDHLKEKYPYPADQNPKVVAFMLGCATHVKADIVFHWTFINKAAQEDFHGDWDVAHEFADRGLDLVMLTEQNQWLVRPLLWWVPVSDLVDVYHKMGKDEYTSAEIVWGNSVMSLAGIGERIIAPASYSYYKWKMPWTANHYYDDSYGGILMNEKLVAEYVENVWERLNGKATSVAKLEGKKYTETMSPALQKVAAELRSGSSHAKVTTQQDGSAKID